MKSLVCQVLIDAAPGGGYSIMFKLDDGTTNTYPETAGSLAEALCYANICVDEVEKITGIKPESLVSAAAIRENRNRDIDARKLWKHPRYRMAR